jgi:DNA-binding MarR family transcriptional regulator
MPTLVSMNTHDSVPSGVELAILLRRAQLRKQMACEAELAQVGMTLPQWGMLLAVASEPDSSTHALAQFTGQSDQSAGAVVARLEQRGLLVRHSERGRAILHRITPDGAELVRRCDEIVSEVMGRLLAGLPDRDLRALATSLAAIAEAAVPVAAAATSVAATAPAIRGDISGPSGNRIARRP